VSGRDTYDPTRGLRECLVDALANVSMLHAWHDNDEQQVHHMEVDGIPITWQAQPELDVIESAIENLLDAQFFADRLASESQLK
jgi:hypothetical protein